MKEPNVKIQELLDHRRERDEQIVHFIGRGSDTVRRLVRAVYPELDKRLVPMATGQILSHLHKLEHELSSELGVLSACCHENTPHLMVVDFDADAVRPSDIVHSVRSRGLHAEMIGL